jgi:hypothetical protein
MSETNKGVIWLCKVPPQGSLKIIPLSPQSLNKPRISGVVYFNEVLKKACFLKEPSLNKQNPSGFIQALQGSPPGIIVNNPLPSFKTIPPVNH